MNAVISNDADMTTSLHIIVICMAFISRFQLRRYGGVVSAVNDVTERDIPVLGL